MRDLLSEMMDSGTPPPAVPPYEAGDPEVSSWRVSPNPAGPEGSHMAPQGHPCPVFEKCHRTSPAPPGARSDELGSVRASVYLRGTPYVDGYGN